MKRDEEPIRVQTTDLRQRQEPEVTSASIKNAHATGDGAVKKTDELLPTEDIDESPTETDTTPY